MRWMAIDHGLARIGIALSDPTGTLATPHEVWPNEAARTIARLAEFVREESVEAIVIGLPRHADGRESETAGAVRTFAAALGQAVGKSVPIELRDEAMTSVEAERILIERGVKPEARKKRRDALAAALILEDLLAERRLRSISDHSG